MSIVTVPTSYNAIMLKNIFYRTKRNYKSSVFTHQIRPWSSIIKKYISYKCSTAICVWLFYNVFLLPETSIV